jgi:hypothetical protein
VRDWWKDDQALAYAILEQGRACCDALLETADTPLDARRLHAAHHGFGLAGYAVSDHLLRGVRPAVWLLVEEAGPVELDGAEDGERALLFAVHGSAAIERCFEIPWLLGQMQSAHRAVRQAHTALTALLGVPAAAQLTIETTRAGRLERTWQQRHLVPPPLAATLSGARRTGLAA